MIGVVTNTTFDILKNHGAGFVEHTPELTLLRPEEVTDPEAVDFLLTFLPDPDVFDRYPNIKAVASSAAGLDGILRCPSLPEGLPVLRVEDPDQALQMAGFAVFHVQWHHRRMDLFLEQQAAHVWDIPVRTRSPREKRVGVMGFGLMGRAIARAVASLGYPTSSLSRTMPAPAEPGVTHYLDTDRAAFVESCDIVINVLPLTPATQQIMNAAFLAALPEGAAIINLGRGQHLDEDALLAALDSGHIAGASLDTFDVEPLPDDHPFWDHPRVLVTPHTASAPTSRGVALSVRDGLARVMAGHVPADRAGRGY